MTVRCARFVVGAYLNEMPPCPDPNGWEEFFYQVVPGAAALRIDTKAVKPWVGYEVASLEVGDSFSIGSSQQSWERDLEHKAGAAWGRLVSSVRLNNGLALPSGRGIFTYSK